MYKLKKNQLGAYCTFCKNNRATHRTKYFHEYVCGLNECLEKGKKCESDRDESDEHYTEADYQIWNK